MLASYISLKYRPLRKFLAGEPTVLIQNGKIMEHNMAKLNYSYDYLTQGLTVSEMYAKMPVKIIAPNSTSAMRYSVHGGRYPSSVVQLDYNGLALPTPFTVINLFHHAGILSRQRLDVGMVLSGPSLHAKFKPRFKVNNCSLGIPWK